MVFFFSYLLYIVQPWQLLEGAFFLLLVITGMLFLVIAYMIKRARRSAKRQKLRRQFGELIAHLAISDTTEECITIMQQPGHQKRMDRWLKDSFVRRLLIRELVNTAKNMSGQSAKNIAWLYNSYKLDNDSLLGLKNSHWHIKARAIQQLAELQQKKHVVKIYRLTNDTNELVRNEARIAVVKLHGFEGLRFLDVISYPLTEWQQISLLQELPQQVEINYEAMSRWLQSSNHSVVEFTLRLIAFYQAHQMHDEVINCLQSPGKLIRQKAIAALEEISQVDTASILIEQFYGEELPNQLGIINVLKQIGTEQEVSFLVDCLHHPHMDVKTESARAIHHIESTGLSLIQKHVNTSVYPWNILLSQLRQESIA
jgi:HEAT repeat protein